MSEFEVGKMYSWAECSFDPITVLSRTAKTITVTNGQNTWRMLVRTDIHGEYVRDSSVPQAHRDMFLCRAKWITH